MDARRNSGSYARKTDYFSHHDPYPTVHVPKSRRPDAQHASNRLDSLPQLNTRLAPTNRNSAFDQIPSSSEHANRPRAKHGTVSDRSPLQKLEGKLDDISKEEKRARLENAEYRIRQDSSANKSKRVQVGQEQTLSHNPNAGYRRHERRHSSAPSPTTEHDGDMQHTRPTLDFRGHSSDVVDTDVLNAGQKFRRASDALRTQSQAQSIEVGRSHPEYSTPAEVQIHLARSNSKSYRHRARDAGYAGAAAAAAMPFPTIQAHDSKLSQERDRRSSGHHEEDRLTNREKSHNANQHTKHRGPPAGQDNTSHNPDAQQSLHTSRLGTGEGMRAAVQHRDPDPVSPKSVKTGNKHGPAYNIPPQTAGGQDARDHVGFSDVQPVAFPQDDQSAKAHHHHGINNLFHRHQHKDGTYRKKPELQEWRQGGAARLFAEDHDVQDPVNATAHTNTPWWDGRGSRKSMPAQNSSGAYDGTYDEPAKIFQPPLFLKCGPLLRYTGMRREKPSQTNRTGQFVREIWRGTVMIVTQDEHSSYEDVPTLRLFAQSMELLPPLPAERQHDPPPNYLDPIAGQMKVSRIGQPLFVRPVTALEDCVDLSRVENESGLFERTRSSDHESQPTHGSVNAHDRRRIRARDGEKVGKYREVKAVRLHRERGVTFWRFNLEIELGLKQARVAYRINRGPAIGFWVPGRGQSMNIMFHSCNGFSLSVNSNEFSGPDPLWRDVLNKHQSRPFHVMLGGGDQIYNDAAIRDTTYFKEWLQTKNPEHKHRADFTEEMQDELETFYLDRYSMWFSQGLFGLANSQIPMVNIWDDHDIIDGYGSYPHHFMSTRIFTGLGAVAFKYYMLFQHQSVVSETHRDEPSWVLGASPGPYINEPSRSVFMFLGRRIAFLGLDCRTERMRDEILSQQSYDIVFDRCRSEIVKGETKHLIVLLGVPIAYPRLNFLENILTSRVMDPIKAIGRTGLLGGFVNKFDGGVEILDDLDDHWTAKHHKLERNWFIQELQELAASKSVRITILGGDVHLGAVGQFYTKKKLGVPKDRDHRYMPNVVSSAIVNTPPPNIMGDVLNKRNKVHHLDAETDEDMIPMFGQDVNGKARNNLHLLPRRNYCSIREYIPGFTPPPSPGLEQLPVHSQDHYSHSRQHPPGSMARSTSANRGGFRPGNLVRRLSGASAKERQPAVARGEVHSMEAYGPSEAEGGPPLRNKDDGGSYFAQAHSRPSNHFHRRPTDLSEKDALEASARGGPGGEQFGHINLESGLDICLNMEIDQKDPAGVTRPYRLLVPALWYEGDADINTARFKSRGASMIDRLRGKSVHRSASFEEYSSESNGSRSSSDSRDIPAPRRLDDRALNSRLPTSGHHPAANSRSRNHARSHDGLSDTHGFNKEVRPPPSRHHHPALVGTENDKAREASLQPPIGPHPSELPTRDKRSWNPFGRRQQQQPDISDPSFENYYTDSEGSFVESELEDDHYRQQPRGCRPSIADRILGRVGAKEREDGSEVEEQSPGQQDIVKKPGWKIWR
ncbi:hypothetical protein QM012_008990 [Aureobasidium pullulans]|uniref:PhoD-like phosphatase domain-containing protein n=1 Tax=Aureobasidium pullulans TaxID=5580 RepID=A0ABR0TI74_AURPU